MTWGRAEPPGSALSRVDTKPIQIERTDHSTVILKNASVQGDSLIGIAYDGSNARVAIPVTEIQGVSERGIDVGKSLELGGGIVLGTLGLLALTVLIIANTSKSPLL